MVFASAQTLYFADSHTAQIGRVLTDGRDYQTLHTSSQSADPFGIVKVVSSGDVDIYAYTHIVMHRTTHGK